MPAASAKTDAASGASAPVCRSIRFISTFNPNVREPKTRRTLLTIESSSIIRANGIVDKVNVQNPLDVVTALDCLSTSFAPDH
ncbi:hypothetical protein DPW01_08955 [Aggregatibacter aphrophilus]|nr:hypothetical protein DPW00_09690 [Aggregatibacter aphrophilus]RDE90283.1 hypothetical protein DPW01_08955 [Aggregatibacter aphrophilus]